MKIVLICQLLMLISVVSSQFSDGEDLQNLLTGPRKNTRKSKVKTINIKIPIRKPLPKVRSKWPLVRLEPIKPLPKVPKRPVIRLERVKPVLQRKTSYTFVEKLSTGTKTDKKKFEVRQRLRGLKGLEDVLREFPPKGITVSPVHAGGVRNPKENRKYMYVKIPRKTDDKLQNKPKVMEFAAQGVCQPTLQCEDLRHLSHQHNGEIWPPSVTYRKCGGCCMDHQEPVVVEYHEPTKVNIIVIPYDHPNCQIQEHVYREHKRCACVCKIKEEHCKASQTYDPETCACNCEASARKECGANKQWSNTDCECTCKHHIPCQKNKIFDKKTCKCECRNKFTCTGFTRWNPHACNCL